MSYVVTLNLMGDIIYERYLDTGVTNMDSKKIMRSDLGKIITATSLLSFDNVKFLMYEEDNHKRVIVNFQEISMIIGLNKEASVSDVLDILSEIVRQY
jgi:hypothetical protein